MSSGNVRLLLLFCTLSRFAKHQHLQLSLASDGRNMTMCQRADVSREKLYLFSVIRLILEERHHEGKTNF